MAYKALYRKYRPRTFDEVIGQEHITKTLANQVKAGAVSHAYLFTGTRGTGKTSTAKIFSKAVNCLDNSEGSPCGKCDACKALELENDINILEIDAASNNRVDDIRELREKVKFSPVGAKYKVYIIDEVHMLTDSAFNALLKTLEEPPAHAIFILATTEVQKLPSTILSRCLRFDFHLVGINMLVGLLKKVLSEEKVKYEEEALKLIAAAGEGSVRDTLSIADAIVAYSGSELKSADVLRVLGTSDRGYQIEFFDALIEKNIGKGFDLIKKLEDSGKNITVFAKDLSVHSRDLLVVKSAKNFEEILNMPHELVEKLKIQAEKANEKELIRYMQIFSGIEAELRYTLSPRLLIETAMLFAIEGGDSKKN